VFTIVVHSYFYFVVHTQRGCRHLKPLYIFDHIIILFLGRKMFQAKVIEKIKAHLCSVIFFFEILAFYEITWKKTMQSREGKSWKYGACAKHAGYL